MKDPGQFVHIKVADGIEPLLRRPISIANIDQRQERIYNDLSCGRKGTNALAKKSR